MNGTQTEQLGLFGPKSSWATEPFFAIDVETTGLNPASNRVIELAIVPFNFDNSHQTYCQLFNIEDRLPSEIIRITGITDNMLAGQPKFADHAQQITNILSLAKFIVAYNTKFDRPFVESELARCDLALPELPWVDPFVFICELDKYKKGKKLTDAANRWGINLDNAHRALSDAKAAGELMLKLADQIAISNIHDLTKQQKIFQWRQDQQRALGRR